MNGIFCNYYNKCKSILKDALIKLNNLLDCIRKIINNLIHSKKNRVWNKIKIEN
jgi:hypothetical protein